MLQGSVEKYFKEVSYCMLKGTVQVQRKASINYVWCLFYFKEKVEKKERQHIRKEQMKPGPGEETFIFFGILPSV